MKILLIGFIVFISWSALSTYIYVCKIKGLCDNALSTQLYEEKLFEPADTETLPDTLPARSLPDEMVITPEKLIVYFDFDRSDFLEDKESERYYSETRIYLDQNPKARIEITGHTCSIGTNQYNQDLGYRRAKSAQNYFVNKGIDANKILINSMGEKEPVENNDTASGRAKNRRSEIIIKN